MFVKVNLLVVRATQHAYDMGLTKPFTDLFDGSQCLLGFFLSIELLFGVATVVAHFLAVGFIKGFPKVVQHHLASAGP